MDFCYARDYRGEYRAKHKPAPGKYDGEPIISCVWCGKTLIADKTTTNSSSGVQDHENAAHIVGGEDSGG